MIHAIAAGALVSGDYFVIDGASIHLSGDTIPVLRDILDAAGIRLVFLPTYSLELNPCELVFSFLKKHMRERSTTDVVWWELWRALTKLKYEHVVSFYKRCLNILDRFKK